MSDVISLPPEQIEAAIARIQAEKERRLAEKVEAGEIINMPLFIVAGSETEARAQVEQAKAAKLKELHDVGDRREVVFAVTMVVTGVVQHGEARDPERAPSAPSFASGEDAPRQHLPSPRSPTPSAEVIEEEAREEPQPPVFETYICVQTRACHDDDDPGEIAEGWFSIDDKVLTVTDANGKYVGSRTMLEGENARVVAKQLLREKAREAESFNRRLSYPNAGLA